MATDIAFALGVLALLGDRVSISLKIFLTALAIVDDLGAVLVIALFYTAEIAWGSLAIGGIGLAILLVANRAGVRGPLVYGLVGALVWVAFLKSGVHATIAGVLIAMTIPARTKIDSTSFVTKCAVLLDGVAREVDPNDDPESSLQSAVEELEVICEQAQTPLQRLDHALHPWVAFAIMPVFALANAGVSIGGGTIVAFLEPITAGVAAGLLVGKQAGVMLFSWLSVRLGFAALPSGVSWRQIYGTSLLAGIGFTMSLFVAGLAFADAESLASAKIGVLGASLVAGLAGWLVLRSTTTARQGAG
jgi:NhaA family Na+:H+ antiporter